MRYSNKELVIIGALAEMQSEGHTNVSLDAIVEKVKPALDPKGGLKFFRSGVASCLRNLQRKLPYEQLGLHPNNVVGRGNKAEFTITGNYREFISAKRVEEHA